MGKISSWKSKYEELEKLGEGGNAEVIKVKKIETGEEYALKPLKDSYAKNSKKPEKRERFKNEINVINQFKRDIAGIIPIIDYNINDDQKEYWYIMPIVAEIKKELENHKDNYSFIVNGIIQLADTLNKLHENGLSHRDIKPENIYFYNERFFIGDFGLASFLDNEVSFTEECALGAYTTMAPEMRRDPHISDGKKADVYSLAKTLWILLTKKEKGFDGVYNFRDKKIGLRYDSIVSSIHVVELEKLLQESTDNDPDKRPTMSEFKVKLEQWLEMKPDNLYSNVVQESQWRFINNFLFGDNEIYIPEIVMWEDKEKIREILSVVASLPAFNHMFYEVGGLDFVKVEDANENDCLYLYEQCICNIIKPKRLIFCNFPKDSRWNYFLLELEEMIPVVCVDEDYKLSYEEVVEDYPGHYVSAQYSQYGVYDYDIGNPFPDGWKQVRRCLNGKFLICPKYGPYNSITESYRGRHMQFDANKFRDYIYFLIQISSKCKEKGINERVILNNKTISQIIFPEEQTTDYMDEKELIAKKYVENSYKNWSFKRVIINSSSNINTNMRFWISYDLNGDKIYFDDDKTVLCNDGYFKNIKDNNDTLYYYCYEDVCKMKENVKKEILNICNSQELVVDECDLHITIECEFVNIDPKHLFTKEEISQIITAADDRHNNVLVINCDGYAEIIQDDIFRARFYPVSHESWNAGNIYVGKYSHLSMLDEYYIASLQGWLDFLQFKKPVYMDYVEENTDENDLIAKINEYYK